MKRLLSVLGDPAPAIDAGLLNSTEWGISIDSRAVSHGDVFFAIRGERFNGADYVDTAHAAGAVLSVVNADESTARTFSSPVIPVQDTVEALGTVAKDYRSLFSGHVIAVTGTSGKTTAKEMMLAVLGKKWSVHGTKGNFNNQIGLPLSVFGLEKHHDCAVFELGMSAPGEIRYLADIAKPDTGVILNVGAGHAEFFESIEDIADSKLELAEEVNAGGVLLVNGDDEMLSPAMQRSNAEVILFGCGEGCQYRATNIAVAPNGCMRFEVMGQTVALNVPGMHNVYNALSAFAVGHLNEIAVRDIADALEAFEAPDKRMQSLKIGQVTVINDTYNANPLSMKAAADVFKSAHGSKKMAVLGDMLELGDMAVESHIAVGRMFAEAGAYSLCLVGQYADLYERGAVEAGMSESRIRKYPDTEAAIPCVKAGFGELDVMLVKGSRSIGMERIVDAVSEE